MVFLEVQEFFMFTWSNLFCFSLGCLALHTKKGLHWGEIVRALFKVRGHGQGGVKGKTLVISDFTKEETEAPP